MSINGDLANDSSANEKTNSVDNDLTDEKTSTLTYKQKRRENYKQKQKQKKLENKELQDKIKSVHAQDSDTQEKVLKVAGEMWRRIKDIVEKGHKFGGWSDAAKKTFFETNDIKDIKYFTEWPDKTKLEYFRTDLNYNDFMTEFPIVSRYMIAMGQYSAKAFRQMLDKIRTVKHPPPGQREKGYMEDQWVRRQADYVKYLWRAYQKGHINTAEERWVWEDAYTKLKKEFDDFRSKCKQVEENVKEEKTKNDISNAKDLLERVKSGEQTVEEKTAEELLKLLRERVIKQRFKKMIKELLETVKCIPATCEGLGTGAEDPDIVRKREGKKDQPVIKMVEHVAEDRMSEVPQEMLLKEEEASKLVSFRDPGTSLLGDE
jgi:hypothetical protein